MNTPRTSTVTAVYKGEQVYVSSSTNLQLRTILTLSISPVAPMSRSSAERVRDLALADESLSQVQITEVAP